MGPSAEDGRFGGCRKMGFFGCKRTAGYSTMSQPKHRICIEAVASNLWIPDIQAACRFAISRIDDLASIVPISVQGRFLPWHRTHRRLWVKCTKQPSSHLQHLQPTSISWSDLAQGHGRQDSGHGFHLSAPLTSPGPQSHWPLGKADLRCKFRPSRERQFPRCELVVPRRTKLVHRHPRL